MTLPNYPGPGPREVRLIAGQSGITVLDWSGNDLQGCCDYRHVFPPRLDGHTEILFYYQAWMMDQTPQKRGLLRIRVCATPEHINDGPFWGRYRQEAYRALFDSATGKSIAA